MRNRDDIEWDDVEAYEVTPCGCSVIHLTDGTTFTYQQAVDLDLGEFEEIEAALYHDFVDGDLTAPFEVTPDDIEEFALFINAELEK